MQYRIKMVLPFIILLILFCILKTYNLTSAILESLYGDSNIEVYSSIIPNAEASTKSSNNNDKSKVGEQDFIKQGNNAKSLTNYTIDEVHILKNLSNRRQALEVKEAELANKEKILEAMERALANKMLELNQLQAKVNNLVKHYEDREKVQIKSLVRIYEHMKPKEAAKIFNELETKMLVALISHMKELKVSPILANMNSARAREVSIALANSSQIND